MADYKPFRHGKPVKCEPTEWHLQSASRGTWREIPAGEERPSIRHQLPGDTNWGPLGWGVHPDMYVHTGKVAFKPVEYPAGAALPNPSHFEEDPNKRNLQQCDIVTAPFSYLATQEFGTGRWKTH